MIICNWFEWPPFCYLAMCSLQKGGQSNQLQIIMHQLCWLGIKQVVYLACSKCTALVKLVLHATIVCSLVAFLASHRYHTFQLFSNLHFLGLTFFHRKDAFWMGYQLCFQSRPLWSLLVWWGCACNHRNKINSQKMFISPSKSLIWWYTRVFPTTTIPFTEASKQVRFCNNMDDTCTEMNLN